MTERLVIDRLGGQGDGIADRPGGPVFVPFALPGEIVEADIAGERAGLVQVLQTSPERIDPACRHFGTCGGCSAQHMAPDLYAGWKRDIVVRALAARDIDFAVDPLVACVPRSRRRAALSARRTERGMLLGYNRALSHDLVDVLECPVMVPAIEHALPALREIAGLICNTPRPFRMLVTETASGLDVAASGSGRLEEKRRRIAAEAVLRLGLARLSIDGEVILEPRRPLLDFGGTAVEPPVGGFVQAVAEAEVVMAGLVCDHLARCRKVADLFSGAGTFALRLARASAVHAVEGDAPALAALDRAVRRPSGLKPVTAERRDLDRRPLTARELDAFDGLVFDPPRAGAEAQCVQIARSKVRRVAAVSCNPGTLARDLRILLDGGYRLVRVVPVDQFLWSAHVEVVALLERSR